MASGEDLTVAAAQDGKLAAESIHRELWRAKQAAARCSAMKFRRVAGGRPDRAVAFYAGTLGLTLFVDAKYDDTWRWIEFQIPGAQTKILLTRGAAASRGARSLRSS